MLFIILYEFSQTDLLEWLKTLQKRYHSPINFNRYELCITNGSMEGLSKVFELVLNSEDPILVDSPCYSGSLDFVCHNKKEIFLLIFILSYMDLELILLV